MANSFQQIHRMDFETGELRWISPGCGKTTCAWVHPAGDRVLDEDVGHTHYAWPSTLQIDRNLLNIKQLKYFLGVLKEGSINKAAARLYVAQPALGLRDGGRQLEYTGQDPRIHEIYLSELRRRGVESKMGRYIDEDPSLSRSSGG